MLRFVGHDVKPITPVVQIIQRISKSPIDAPTADDDVLYFTKWTIVTELESGCHHGPWTASGDILGCVNCTIVEVEVDMEGY
jgi:hypothetical protein